VRRAAGLLLLVATLAAAGSPASAAEPERDDRRLLVLSLPGLTWRDFHAADAPNLRALLAESAVASLAPARTLPHDAGPADAYMTFGAGTRAIGAPRVDGDQVEPDELVAGGDVAELFGRRMGEVPDADILSLGYATLLRENDDMPYDADLGAVAEELLAEGVRLGVVANADGVDGPVESDRNRQAALALTSPDGVVASGAVAADLLRADPAAPFGVELDPDRVFDEFEAIWNELGPAVVLVEASDLARVQRYARFATPEQRAVMLADAIHAADDLAGRLLAEVDPERDAVLVVAPSEGRRKLTVTGLRTPDIDGGLLRSASSQHAGVVSTVDVGPTILDTFGIGFTEHMEGRPYERASGGGGSLAHREKQLIDDARGAARRSERLFPMTALLVVVLSVVVLATIVVVAQGADATARRRHIVAWLALFALAALPSTLLVQLFGPLGGIPQYALVVAIIAAVIATAVWFVPTRPYGPLLAMLGMVLGVILVDAITGSRLSYNATFGYSPTANSRLYGISNYSFGQVLATSLLLASFALLLVKVKYAFAVVCALLGFVVVVEGMPAWGSDVGGVLAGVPTFLLFVFLVRQGKVRARTVVIGAVLTVLAIAVFAGIDLARPSDERAHLGRLVERVSEDGLDPLVAIVERKFTASLRESTRSFWVVAIPVGIGLIIALSRLGERPLARLRRNIPALGIALSVLYFGAVLGSALNDSGAIVGGLLFFTLANALAYLALEDGMEPAEEET